MRRRGRRGRAGALLERGEEEKEGVLTRGCRVMAVGVRRETGTAGDEEAVRWGGGSRPACWSLATVSSEEDGGDVRGRRPAKRGGEDERREPAGTDGGAAGRGVRAPPSGGGVERPDPILDRGKGEWGVKGASGGEGRDR